MEIWVVIDYAPVIFASRFTVRMFCPNVSTFVFFQGTFRQRLSYFISLRAGVTKLCIGSPRNLWNPRNLRNSIFFVKE